MPSSSFKSLSPIHDADQDWNYEKALNWAFFGPESQRILNIAISGPFGSGKSSVLKTYQKSNRNEKLKFLNVSLATFKEESETTIDGKGCFDSQKQIEISILQQIFYHVNRCEIPDSRIKRIAPASIGRFVISGLISYAILMACFFVAFEEKITKFFNIDFTEIWRDRIHFTAAIVLLAGGAYLISEIIRYSRRLRLSKLSFNDATLEIGENCEKSILNEYIDEILYFFEATKYNVVVIEDLDRFQQTEIFTKLREINLLINNSDAIKRKVVFVYSIKDDLFGNADRTKFFDFIIPVIPVVNSSNSSEILRSKFKNAGCEIGDDIIDDLSFFIGEMRLLHNIMNEFLLYKAKLNPGLPEEKLFAMICYKNLHPKDFFELPKCKGILYSYFANKGEVIKQNVALVDADIIKLQGEICEYEKWLNVSLVDLKKVYLYHLLERAFVAANGQGIQMFNFGSRNYRFDELIEEDAFNRIAAGAEIFTNTYSGGRIRIDFRFAEIEKSVDANNSYSDKKRIIEAGAISKIDACREKINSKRIERESLKVATIQSIAKNSNLFKDVKQDDQNRLIQMLLRLGYIDEDYLNYISIFHEGSLTKADFDFIINVKTGIKTPFEYKLSKVDKIIERIGLNDLVKPEILNADLATHFASTQDHSEKRKAYFKWLSSETSEVIEFLSYYLGSDDLNPNFVILLCESWRNAWSHIAERMNFTSDKIERLFFWILKYGTNEAILRIADSSNFKSFYESRTRLDCFDGSLERLRDHIQLLELKFNTVEIINSSYQIGRLIVDESAFVISIKSLEVIVCKVYKIDSDIFKTRNFESILMTGSESLKAYLISNIDLYINNIYLELPLNTDENEDILLELLSLVSISETDRDQTIAKVAYTVQHIAKVHEAGLLDAFVRLKKIPFQWATLVDVYSLNGDSIESISSLLNDSEFTAEATRRTLQSFGYSDDHRKSFVKAIVHCEAIQNDCYRKLMSSLGYVYKSFSPSNLSKEKVEILVDSGVISLTPENTNMIRSKFPDILSRLYTRNSSSLIALKNQLGLTANEVSELVREKKIRAEILGSILSSEFTEGSDDYNMLVSSIVESIRYLRNSIPETYRQSILNEMDSKDAIFLEIFIDWGKSLSHEFIRKTLLRLSDSFVKIATASSKLVVADGTEERKVVEMLKSAGFIKNYSITKRGISIVFLLN